MKLTKNAKLSKLGNAIREYRGVAYIPANDDRPVVWKRAPKPQAVDRILRWLAALNVTEPIVALADIQEFKSFDEMRAWLSKL